MGDILGAIFGTSSTTTQQTIPDPISQQLNQWRLQQYQDLLRSGSIREFGDPHSEYYQPTNATQSLIRGVSDIAGTPIDYSNLVSLSDYKRSFDPVTSAYEASLRGLDTATMDARRDASGIYDSARGVVDAQREAALGRSYADYGTGVGTAATTYGQGTADVNAAYNAAIQRGDYDLARAISLNEQGGLRALDINQGNYANALNRTAGTTNEILGLNEANFQRGIGLNEAGLLRSLGISEADAQRSLATQDANRARALELGIGATGNYIDQIARPQLEQVMALQGLERGGALPAAIARATAETAMPYLQSIENTYGTNQANTLNALMGLRGELTGNNTALNAALVNNLMELQTATGNRRAELENAITQQFMTLQSGTANQMADRNAAASQTAQQGNVALGGQRIGAQANLAGNYQNNVAQLAQALMANNVSLEQAGIAANSALGQELMQAQTTLRNQQQQGITSLGNTYGSNAASFASTLPGASQSMSLLPGQMQASRAATLTGLQPLADFSRQLTEADFLRRQGLFTTAYTGIPYTPGGTVAGGTATGNIFDQLSGTLGSFAAPGGNINR